MIRNKLASLEAKLVRNYDRVTLLTRVREAILCQIG